MASLAQNAMTAKELAAALDEELNSVRPRVAELKAQGKIIESGERRERQHVWKTTSSQ
jgi:hypothetical protein